ncbi:unnamed protein product [Musa acuminata subsp. burmannicoides]
MLSDVGGRRRNRLTKLWLQGRRHSASWASSNAKKSDESLLILLNFEIREHQRVHRRGPSRQHLSPGQIANVAQLAGLDAVRLIIIIVEAAAKARIQKQNCRELSDFLQLIGHLLEPLDMSDLKTYPETRAVLERLENALKKAYILVNICQNHSFLYLMAMGWMLEHRFQKVEAEIERYLRLIPLINLVDVQRSKNEMNVLRKLSHPNLIRLLGYCKEENAAFHLVYEFMANGSLQDHLLEKGKPPLSWKLRIKIAIGAARCLRFLHKSNKRIIHRDVKPSVILLDSDFNPKLSGLGWSLSLKGRTGRRGRVSTHVLGTPGYLDPRYFTIGHLDAKTDVYAFGIVLLQMLTGRKVFDPDRPCAERHLAQFAKPHLSSDAKELASLMDPKLNGEYPPATASRLARIIEACIEKEHKLRPTMKDVVKALEKIDAI